MGFTNAMIGQEVEKYAWFPVRTTSKKWIWRKKYYAILEFRNTETVRYVAVIKRLTEKEYTMYLLTKPSPRRPVPPTTGSSVKPRQKPITR